MAYTQQGQLHCKFREASLQQVSKSKSTIRIVVQNRLGSGNYQALSTAKTDSQIHQNENETQRKIQNSNVDSVHKIQRLGINCEVNRCVFSSQVNMSLMMAIGGEKDSV